MKSRRKWGSFVRKQETSHAAAAAAAAAEQHHREACRRGQSVQRQSLSDNITIHLMCRLRGGGDIQMRHQMYKQLVTEWNAVMSVDKEWLISARLKTWRGGCIMLFMQITIKSTNQIRHIQFREVKEVKRSESFSKSSPPVRNWGLAVTQIE